MTGNPVRALAIIGVFLWALSCTEKEFPVESLKPADKGPCAYEVYRESKPFFTIQLNRPSNPAIILSKVREHIALNPVNRSNSICPCGSRIFIDNQGIVTRVEPMPATSLVSIGAPINVNRATDKDLVEIPGIGPKLGKSIIEYRSRKGRYASITELRSIHGLGPTKISNIAKYVTFEDPNLSQQASVFPIRNLSP